VSILAKFIRQRAAPERDWPTGTLQDYIDLLQWQGNTYLPQPQQTLGGRQEEIVTDLVGVTQGALKSSGVVAACVSAKARLASEATFTFRRRSSGRPGDMFGAAALAPLQEPWPGATTGDLIARLSMDLDLVGNAFAALGPPSRPGGPNTIRRLRPDWVTIVGGSHLAEDEDNPLWQWDVEPIGYLYHPGGRSRSKPQVLLPAEVAHAMHLPDPEAALIGTSPLAAVVKEVMGDKAMTQHKLKFFENGATPNMVVSLPEAVTPSQFPDWVKAFNDEHEGVANAYRTIYLGGGADVNVVGANLQQLDFKVTQSHGETRVCSALGMEPIIVGVSEGLQRATHSNYAQAARSLGDTTMRPLWRNLAGSLARVVDVPEGAELWYDDRDIAFLREDSKDQAQVEVQQAEAGELWVRAGFKPDSVVKALAAHDITLLEHSGLASVQLQPLGKPANGTGNGNGSGRLSKGQ
jgi:HK97 family phage portal protein